MDTSKIIIGTVGGGRYTVTAPIVKEDYGLYLKIEGLELPATYEVDFSNSEHNGTSVTMIGNSDGVLIPSQFIKSGKDVFAFLYHVGADFGRTVYKFRIPNKLRPDRTEETPTPTQQSVIDQAISALNSAVAQTAQDVIDADASAQSASDDADRAEEARTDAQNYATQAEQSATDAQTSASQASASATASAQSASQSAQIKADVEDLVDDAQASASASAQSATASANSASQASGYAQSASASANSASGYASQADISANTASNKASEASTSASTASTKASESAQSASQALTYKTDAESAKTASQTAQGLAESARDTAVSAKADAESARDDAETARDEAQQTVASISGALADKAPVITDTASGAIASFSDGADDLPLKSLVVDINPVQDLHGYDSPWPAGGGKNKLPLTVGGIKALNQNTRGTWTGNSYTYLGITYTPVTDSDGNIIKIHVSGTKTGASYFDLAKINSIPYGTYILNGGASGINVRAYHFDGTHIVSSNSAAGTQFTSTEGAGNNTFDIVVATDIEVNADVYPMVRLTSETDATFTPYENLCPISGWTGMQLNANGTVIPISWQTETGTVYGGRLDVLSGKLTVYPYYASYNGETLTGEWISDRDVYAVGTTPTIGAQVVNIGAEGTEIQLEPHEVASLLGANNIFADTGDTSVEYRADTKLYINRLTEPDADMIADSNIVSGQYFMVGNNLYKATANIASGASVIVGTNCTRKSLSEALNEINS